MTKTTRTSSYLSQVTRHHGGNLLLLKPPHTLAQHWRKLSPHESNTETMQPAQYPATRTGVVPLLQDIAPISTQRATELQPALSTTKTAQPAVTQEATAPSSALPTRLLSPVALPGSSPAAEETAPSARDQQPQMEVQRAPAKSTRMSSSAVIEETTSTISHQQPEVQRAPAKSTRMSSSAATTELAPLVSHQQPQMEIQLAPAKSMHSTEPDTSRSSPATQITFDRQTRASGEKKPASVTLRPLSRQQQEVTSTLTNSSRSTNFADQDGNANTRAPEPQRRSAVLQNKQETLQHPAIHIGTIDIHIMPPTPAVPLPPARSTTVRPHSTLTLSREMTSFIGLRQG